MVHAAQCVREGKVGVNSAQYVMQELLAADGRTEYFAATKIRVLREWLSVRGVVAEELEQHMAGAGGAIEYVPDASLLPVMRSAVLLASAITKLNLFICRPFSLFSLLKIRSHTCCFDIPNSSYLGIQHSRMEGEVVKVSFSFDSFKD